MRKFGYYYRYKNNTWIWHEEEVKNKKISIPTERYNPTMPPPIIWEEESI